MAPQIPLSQIIALGYTAETFKEAVEEYRQARIAHSKTIGVPAPAPKLAGIEPLVIRIPPDAENDEKFVTEYEVLNDLPPPAAPPTLEQKKTALAHAAAKLAGEAFEANAPALRRRLWGATAARIEKIAPEDRSADDNVFFEQHQARLEKQQDINFHLGVLESQIHDLTEETVDSWKPKAFPT